MDWYHETNKFWLAARKKYLTASDIIKMLPVTPQGKPRSASQIESLAFAVWAEKMDQFNFGDVTSRGPMGRGHHMEPYAINEFNELVGRVSLHHWDDALIHRGGEVAFSPDALSIAQIKRGIIVEWGRPLYEKVTSIGEIKSYGAVKHYLNGARLPKEYLDERWQLAVGMHVLQEIEDGHLIFFNPSTPHPILIRSYTRVELEDELDIIDSIVTNYRVFAEKFSDEYEPWERRPVMTEAQIISEIEAAQAIEDGILNP